jgi:AcrR family transcriptional regulator
MKDVASTSGTSTQEGLRQRKKQATRDALSDIALRLAVERGLAKVRVEDIAEEAGVSIRTFSNYFPNKEAAIVANAVNRAERVMDALRARPADEPLWEALTNAVVALFPVEPERDWTARSYLIRGEPSLAAAEECSNRQVEQILIKEIARRTKSNPNHDIYPRLAAAAILSAVNVALDLWLTSPPGTELRAVLRRATSMIRVESPSPGGSERTRPKRAKPRAKRR